MSTRMSPVVAALGAVAIAGAAAAFPVLRRDAVGRGGEVRPVNSTEISSVLADAPLSFIENRGQIPGPIRYYVQGAGASVGFSPRGLALSLPHPWAPSNSSILEVRFAGARAAPPVARGRAEGIVSYFTGPPEEWVTGLPTFSRVVYRDPWPGIDLHFSGTGSQLKYSAVVEPGAAPASIRLRWRGAKGLEVNARGQLKVTTSAGTVVEDVPYAYQDLDGRRVEVEASYELLGGGAYGFDVGPYDPTRPLVIDPPIFIYAGYIGGSDVEVGQGIAVDSAGAAYVTGEASSTEATFPVTGGPDTTYNGGGDAFAAKVAPGGGSLIYAGYIGGSGFDSGRAIAVDGAGAAYVAGSTGSTEATFPVAGGPDTTYNGALVDAFVAKVAPGGGSLTYAGYIGGSDNEGGNGIAVDGAGAAYVTGQTGSTEASFPDTGGPDTTYNGGQDAFVAKVAPGGGSLTYAGYIGGSDVEGGRGIAVDGAGAAYVAGVTGSDQTTFPDAGGPDTTFNGALDVFVAKVAPGGASLTYAGYIGGSGSEDGRGIAVDGAGAAYVTGRTSSDQATFPVAGGPDTTYNGLGDAFVAKVLPSGASLTYAGYIGGSVDDAGNGIAVDAAGAAHVTGDTGSDQTTFPVTEGPDTTYNGTGDAFVAKVAPGGGSFTYAGYIGGSDGDFGLGVAVDGAGAAYVTGLTSSGQSTFPVTGGPDTTYNGGGDAFVAKVAEAAAAGAPPGGGGRPGVPGAGGGRCRGEQATVLGTSRRDILVGNGRRNVMAALGGNDLIRALGGPDLTCGGRGKDRGKGGPGTDRVFGGPGNDVNLGGAGRDSLHGGPGNDECRGGKGTDSGVGCEGIFIP